MTIPFSPTPCYTAPMATPPTYAPLQRIIRFDRNREPQLAWVTSTAIHPDVTYLLDKVLHVRVVSHHEDALEGRAQGVASRHLQPHSETLWAACEEWHRRRAQLEADFEALRKGKIPADYLQPTLFG